MGLLIVSDILVKQLYADSDLMAHRFATVMGYVIHDSEAIPLGWQKNTQS